jgi:hypothetical protein
VLLIKTSAFSWNNNCVVVFVLVSAVVIAVRVRGKISRHKSWRLRCGMGCWASNLSLTFGTTRTVELSALGAGRTLPPRKLFGAHLCYRLSRPRGYWMRAEGIGHLIIAKDPTENRKRNFPSCWCIASINCGTVRPRSSSSSSSSSSIGNTDLKLFSVLKQEVCVMWWAIKIPHFVIPFLCIRTGHSVIR